ncbi:MAG: DNA gyrase inhibitor YacG [Gammaproteobacteria bacterium]
MLPLVSLRCPHCGGPASARGENPWRPFCSERCRLIDLGAWLDEGHRIPTEEADGALQEVDGSDPDS